MIIWGSDTGAAGDWLFAFDLLCVLFAAGILGAIIGSLLVRWGIV